MTSQKPIDSRKKVHPTTAVQHPDHSEISMTDDAAPHIQQDTTWHLLGEFSLPAGLDSEPRLTEWITGSVWELGLQTAQLKRVCEAVIGAVRNTIRHRNRGRRNASVSVRIWLSAAYTRDRSPAGPEATPKIRRERRGWGFFLIQKPKENPLVSDVASQRVIELFLYQERGLSRKYL